MTIPDVLVGVLIAFLVASFLAIFQYIIAKKLESGQWQRVQRGKEMEHIDDVATDIVTCGQKGVCEWGLLSHGS